MSAFGPERLAMLVQPDRVHRSVYADPAIFDLEMERIFGRAWLVLGHESQVKRDGDYFTTRMGREPVIVASGNGGMSAAGLLAMMPAGRVSTRHRDSSGPTAADAASRASANSGGRRRVSWASVASRCTLPSASIRSAQYLGRRP